jgi:hypothetical protein
MCGFAVAVKAAGRHGRYPNETVHVDINTSLGTSLRISYHFHPILKADQFRELDRASARKAGHVE